MDETIYVKVIQSLIIGRSISYPEGWIKIDDLEKIIQKYKNGEINRFGKEIK